MSDKYILMRKNDPITLVELSDGGRIVRFSKELVNPNLYPLEEKRDINGLPQWWNDRAAPISQGRMREFLHRQGLSETTAYLTKNLGLSLMDYYWIRPVDSNIRWEDVNLFDNDFKDDRLISLEFDESKDSAQTELPKYSPNGSLIGNIEKTWTIVNGKRCLIKGNTGALSSESINEVIASRIHELQGYDNYVKYNLIKIKDSRYDYGCISELFTSQKMELVSAWAIHTSEKRNNNLSHMEHLIKISGDHGIDTEQLRRDIDYQIMTDFIISGHDRHYNNMGVLRDADTLEFIRMAPIFDSGGSFFSDKKLPRNRSDLLKIKTNSFFGTERKLIEHVSDPMVVDLDKLPAASYIREMYEMDSQVSKETINAIVFSYEKKIEMCHDIQKGINPWHQQYSLGSPSDLNVREEMENDYEPSKGGFV